MTHVMCLFLNLDDLVPPCILPRSYTFCNRTCCGSTLTVVYIPDIPSTCRPDWIQLNTHALRSLKVTFAELRTIVAENDKQRFSLIPMSSLKQPSTTIPNDDAATATSSDAPTVTFEVDAEADVELDTSLTSDDPTDFLIRANQGHSLAVDSEDLLELITLENAPALCVHGTTHSAWPLILESGGLKRMTRTHVHFASGLPKGMSMLPDDENEVGKEDSDAGSSIQAKDAPVISGMRSTSSILVYIDVSSALSSGLEFFRSENGVLLCAGEADTGVVPLKFFKRVEERKDGLGILMRDGQVVKELPARSKTGGSGQKKKGGK